MSRQDVVRPSFASGEISPQLYARNDLAKHQTAVARCENMVVLIEGGLTRSPGSVFVDYLKDQSSAAIIVPFQVSRDDSYALVINGGVVRVIRNGGVVQSGSMPYEFAIPWASADLINLRWAQSADTVFFACRGYKLYKIVRYDHADWRMSEFVPTNGPVDIQNINESLTLRASAVSGPAVLTANHSFFKAGDEGGIIRLDEPNLGLTPLWVSGETDIAVGAQRRWNGNTYMCVVAGRAGNNAPVHTEGDVAAGLGLVFWRFLHGSSGTCVITRVINETSAEVVIQTQLSQAVASSGTYRWFAPAWSSSLGYPTNVRLHQSRLWFFRGDKFWASELNDYSSFESGTLDTQALSGRIVAPDGQLVEIQWVMSSKILVLGAASGEWIVRATEANGILTPASVGAFDDSSEGSAAHIPARVDGGAIFIGRSASRMHYVQMDVIAERLSGQELTVTARHLLTKARRVTWQRDPHRILWVVDAAGALFGLTFMPEQGVVGWHRHPRSGVIEDIASVRSADGLSDEIYLTVKRIIGGTTRRYVEKMAPFFVPDEHNPTALGAIYMESALEYSGAPTTTITGLNHLEGMEIGVMADGKNHNRKTVQSGRITLDFAASRVVAGLPLSARVVSLPIEAPLVSGSDSKTKVKNIHAILIDRVHSLGGSAAPNGGEFQDFDETGGEPYDSVPNLRTDRVRVAVLSEASDVATVEISIDSGLPFTLTGLLAQAEFED